MAKKTFRINGRVINVETRRGITGLRVEAWDRDLLFHDMVGSTFTGGRGAFRMIFDDSAFKELFLDRKPDLFFKVYEGKKLIKSTKNSTLWNVESGTTEVLIEIETAEEPGEGPVFPDPGQFPGEDPDEGQVPGEPVHPPGPGEWRSDISAWWKERQSQKPPDEGKVPMPRPFLDCTSNFGPQFVPLAVDEPGTLTFPVWNDGNFPSISCYVQVYEGPGGYSHPLSDYELRGQAIITLNPGERREVALPWVRHRTTGRVVGICFDPLLDPIDFTVVEQVNRHITSIHYTNLR